MGSSWPSNYWSAMRSPARRMREGRDDNGRYDCLVVREATVSPVTCKHPKTLTSQIVQLINSLFRAIAKSAVWIRADGTAIATRRLACNGTSQRTGRCCRPRLESRLTQSRYG